MKLHELHEAITPETKIQTAQTVFGTGVGGGGFILTTDFIIFVLTAIYLIASIGLLIPKYIREFRAWKNKKEAIDADSQHD